MVRWRQTAVERRHDENQSYGASVAFLKTKICFNVLLPLDYGRGSFGELASAAFTASSRACDTASSSVSGSTIPTSAMRSPFEPFSEPPFQRHAVSCQKRFRWVNKLMTPTELVDRLLHLQPPKGYWQTYCQDVSFSAITEYGFNSTLRRRSPGRYHQHRSSLSAPTAFESSGSPCGIVILRSHDTISIKRTSVFPAINCKLKRNPDVAVISSLVH